jgi:hypothetical protein
VRGGGYVDGLAAPCAVDAVEDFTVDGGSTRTRVGSFRPSSIRAASSA